MNQESQPKGSARRGPLFIFIKKHFKTHRALANDLGVAPQTITNWLHSTPLQMLKHTDAIRKSADVTVVELTTACLGQLRHIERKERAKRLEKGEPPLDAKNSLKTS